MTPKRGRDGVLAKGLESAAIRWWRSRRPGAWTENQHLANAPVNTSSEEETDLCWAIAKIVAKSIPVRRSRGVGRRGRGAGK